MTIETVKGFRDYSGEEAQKRAEIKNILIENFELYGFEPAETPIIEYEEFVKGNNQDDEAVSDIFKLQDKGKRKLALRYEFTFQLKRLMKNKKIPYKRYQVGEVFRNEPVSSNRFRQFTQCDIDVIGSTIKDEAEILAMTNQILKNLELKPIILVNNRVLLNEILDKEKIKENYKEPILREIDKFDKIGEKQVKTNLKKFGAEKVLEILKQKENYFTRFENYKEIVALKEYCKMYGVEIVFSPTLVRGLSYYKGNVFEIKVKDMRETLVGGGTYNFNNVQCTGLALGLERISKLSQIEIGKEKILVVSLGQDKESIKIAEKLRNKKMSNNNKMISIYYGKPSKALEYANSYNFNKVVFVGEKEIKSKKFKIKDMKTGKESLLKL